MSTVLDHVTRALDRAPELDDLALAREVIAELDPSDLTPLVARVVAQHRRARTRHLERIAFNPQMTADPDAEHDRMSARKQLIAESFPLGDGRFVTWGDATIADHEQRIDLLTANQLGLAATIARHRDAIALITAHKVTCLADLEVWAA